MSFKSLGVALLLVLPMLTLTGCEQVEHSAQQVLDKAAQSAKQAIDDTHKAAEQALSDAAHSVAGKDNNQDERARPSESSQEI